MLASHLSSHLKCEVKMPFKKIPSSPLIVAITIGCLLLFACLTACDETVYDCRDYPCDPTNCPIVIVDCPDSRYYLESENPDEAPSYDLDEAFDACTGYHAEAGTGEDGEWEIKACSRGQCYSEPEILAMVCVE
jgi:hypothetical protein